MYYVYSLCNSAVQCTTYILYGVQTICHYMKHPPAFTKHTTKIGGFSNHYKSYYAWSCLSRHCVTDIQNREIGEKCEKKELP